MHRHPQTLPIVLLFFFAPLGRPGRSSSKLRANFEQSAAGTAADCSKFARSLLEVCSKVARSLLEERPGRPGGAKKNKSTIDRVCGCRCITTLRDPLASTHTAGPRTLVQRIRRSARARPSTAWLKLSPRSTVCYRTDGVVSTFSNIFVNEIIHFKR